jgi:hypothetical protein
VPLKFGRCLSNLFEESPVFCGYHKIGVGFPWFPCFWYVLPLYPASTCFHNEALLLDFDWLWLGILEGYLSKASGILN